MFNKPQSNCNKYNIVRQETRLLITFLESLLNLKNKSYALQLFQDMLKVQRQPHQWVCKENKNNCGFFVLLFVLKPVPLSYEAQTDFE